ncbi:MAG: mechanosensitive ion channel family protein [Steroidobacteraceae bacterium]
MESLTHLLDTVFLANSLRSWLLAGLVFCATFLVVPFVRARIAARLHARRPAAGRTESATPELLEALASRTSRLVLLSVALYFAEKILSLPDKVDRAFNVIIVFGVAVQFALWAVAALGFFINRHYARRGGEDASSRASVTVLMFVGQLLIWAMFTLLALDNLGVNVTALVAGMGVGGIAIALAVQTILGDLLGSLSIALDKPFVVGDSLRIDDIEGRVEYVGIKSTRLRSVTGEQVILANADVLKSRVRNLGRMPERRVNFRLRFAYGTPAADLAKVPALVEGVVKAVSDTRFVSCLLVEIGAYALEFEVTYFIANTGNRVGAATDAVNRGILAQLEAAGLALTYPTQRAVSQDPSAGPAQ